MKKFSLLFITIFLLLVMITSMAFAYEGSGLPKEKNTPVFNLDVEAVKAKKFTIGFSQCVMDHPYRVDMVERAKKTAEKYGVKLIATDGQGQASIEVSNIQSMIARGVDAICISSHGGVAITPALSDAKKAGIPIILLDGGRPYEDWEFVTWMSSDDWQLGRRAGYMMAIELSGKGNVAMIEGSPGSSCQQGRREGFLEAISEFPEIKLVANQQGNWLTLPALNIVSNILQAHPDLKAIYCHNDEMCIGAIEAIKKTGKIPGKDILVYSAADQQANTLPLIKAGELQLTQLYVDDGGYALEAALYHLMGGEMPKIINLGTTFVTQNNVDEYKPAY
jgi:ribose transport system substrate-binding protein